MDTNNNQEKNPEAANAATSAKTKTAGRKSAENRQEVSASTENAKETAAAKSAAAAAKNNSEDRTQSNGKNQKPSETDKEGPLFKFFTDMLKDVYYAEKHILEALPKMQKAATTDELQDAFEDHHLQTQKHVSRLEKVFRMIGEEPEVKKCDAIEGIVREGQKCIEDTEEGSMTRDAALIIAAQKVEHYEIASYGGLCALAETLGQFDASDLLHKTLEEEDKTDSDLTHIAESYINFCATEDDSENNRHRGGRGRDARNYQREEEEAYYEDGGYSRDQYRRQSYH